MIAALVPLPLLLGLSSPPTGEETRLRALAERCGSQIEWLRDRPAPDEGGAAFQYLERGPPKTPQELEALLSAALDRARGERRFVLWHVWRLQGGHMYRAGILDDYMDQVFWSEPEVVRLVAGNFVPLRTECPRPLGERFGLRAWDVVEPALVFLNPDGRVVHRIDRIRTFDPKWMAEVLRRVLAANPAFDPQDAPSGSAESAFVTAEEAALEASRRSYYEALCAYLAQDEPSALSRWKELTEASPESPFAWRAASNLLPAPDKTFAGAARHAFEWPFESWLPPGDALPTDTRWRRTAAEAQSVAENGVRWLLRMQRPDGSWNDCRYAYWNSPAITPNAWMAITALAACALLEWRDLDPVAIDSALARAEGFLFRDGRLNEGKNEECYAHAYRIEYVARALTVTQEPAQRSELLGRAQELVERLGRMLGAAGQWAHEYDNAFSTAAVLDALDRARRAGLALPDAQVARALDGLAAARYEDGSFAYGGRVGKGATPPADSLKNSCGRMPACEGALFAWGRSDLKSLAKALSIYQQYYDRFEKVSKCDFHTDGELGGFFFFHDLYMASQAVRRLPPAGQKGFRRFLLERITSLPEIDGSVLDDHEVGKSCSTSYALLALRDVMAEPPR
jgi:hypothetical protein